MQGDIDVLLMAVAVALAVTRLVTDAANIYKEILGVAEKAEADLVVVGSHRPAMKDYLLGANAGCVVRHARCSVLVAGD
jgi:nucleotide-binding universal stress UspA family protein